MEPKKKRHSLLLSAVGAVLTMIAAYYCAGGMRPGSTIWDWRGEMQHVFENPFVPYWNQYTGRTILVFLLIYMFADMMYLAGRRNYLPGKEMGSAQFADVKKVNKCLADLSTSPDAPGNITVLGEKRKKQIKVVNTRNRILSQNIKMTLNTRHTDLNNNILVIGGSGSGKTYRFVKPQLLQMSSSFIITDPKGELYRDTSSFLKQNGYDIKVLNLLNEQEMAKSSHFNPFRYIQSEVDVLKLITNLISNTTPKGASNNDPFWEKAEGMLLQALFYYVWLEGVPERLWECKTPAGEDNRKEILERIHNPEFVKVHNVRAVMALLKYAEFREDPRTGAKLPSTLDVIMEDLEKRVPNHKAVLNYNKAMRGAADTVRSIIISANARLAPVETEAVLSVLDDDEMDIPMLGTRRTAIYCVIPDNDTTYNFLVGILYSMMFQQLYYEADFVHGGALPVHVTFMLDEFDNIALPEDFLSLLSTMRSRNINSVIIIQDLSQIKTRYKDGAHEKILGNCDTIVYLGGNGPGTAKDLSELLGKATIDKRTSGETFGKQGSSSRNYDILGRELMLPDEFRKLKKNRCILFIRGFDPILDNKINTRNHPLWGQMEEAQKGGLFDARIERLRKGGGVGRKYGFVDDAELAHLELMDKKEQKYYEEEKRVAEMTGRKPPKEPQAHIIKLNFAELDSLEKMLGETAQGEQLLDARLLLRAKKKMEEQIAAEEAERIEWEAGRIDVRAFHRPEEALAYAGLKRQGFSERQMKCILRIIQSAKNQMDLNELLGTFDPEMDMETIETITELILQG